MENMISSQEGINLNRFLSTIILCTIASVIFGLVLWHILRFTGAPIYLQRSLAAQLLKILTESH